MEFPSLGYRNGRFQSYGICLRYWSEGLILVNTMHLLKAFGNKPIFVSTNMAIRCSLGHADPYAYDKFPPIRNGNQILSQFLEEGVVLLLHSGFPKGISSSLSIILWI
jgi:hypothetical protein